MRGVVSVFARRGILLWLCFVAGTGGGAALARVVARADGHGWVAHVAFQRSYPEPADEVLARVAADEGAYAEPPASGTTMRLLLPAGSGTAASEMLGRIVSNGNLELRRRAAARLEKLRKKREASLAEAAEARKHRDSAIARKHKIRGELPGEFNELMQPTGRAESQLATLRRERKRVEGKIEADKAAIQALSERLRSLPEMVVVRVERPDWMSHPGYLSLKTKGEELRRSLEAASGARRQALAAELDKIEARLSRLETLTKDPPVKVEGPNPARAEVISRMNELREERASYEALAAESKKREEDASARVTKVLEGSKEAKMLEATIAERRGRAEELAREIDSSEDEARRLEVALAGPDPLEPSRALKAPGEARMSWREVVGLGMVFGICAGLALVAIAEALRPAVRTPEDLQDILGIPPVAVIRRSAPGVQLPDWRSGAVRKRARVVGWLVAVVLAAMLAGGALFWPEIRSGAEKEAHE